MLPRLHCFVTYGPLTYLQVENWQNLTTASFISAAKNDLVLLWISYYLKCSNQILISNWAIHALSKVHRTGHVRRQWLERFLLLNFLRYSHSIDNNARHMRRHSMQYLFFTYVFITGVFMIDDISAQSHFHCDVIIEGISTERAEKIDRIWNARNIMNNFFFQYMLTLNIL